MTIIGKLDLRPGTERRGHPRATDLDIPTTVVVDGVKGGVQLRTLSVAGGLLHGRLGPEVVRGEAVELRFEIDGIPLSLRAEILRVDVHDAHTDAVAFALRDLQEAASASIERFVANALEAAPAEALDGDDTVRVVRAPTNSETE